MKNLLPLFILVFTFPIFGQNGFTNLNLSHAVALEDFLSINKENGFMFEKVLGAVKNETVANCTYTTSPTNQSFSSGGGTGTFNLTTESGCAWTAQSNVSWITISSGANGTGNGSVQFTVAYNDGPPRTGTITIGGQIFTINQSNACTYSLTSSQSEFPYSGGTGTINVTTQMGCTWAATIIDGNSWITISSGASGTGSGTIDFSVSLNIRSGILGQRTAFIAVGGQSVRIFQQRNCTTNPSPNSISISKNGGAGLIQSNPGSGCYVDTAVNVPWITAVWRGGYIEYSVSANPGVARTGTITATTSNGPAESKTITINQAEGCPIISAVPAKTTFSGEGGISTINVTAPAGCTWEPVTNVPWISFPAPSGGNGNGTISFRVSENYPDGNTGIISIAGQQQFTITKTKGCYGIYSLSSTSGNFEKTGGTGTVNVSTSAECTWSVANNISWITVTNPDDIRSGNGTVNFTLAANSGPGRAANLTIAGKNYYITQASGCTFSLSSAGTNVDAVGGTSSFNITTNESECSWSINAPSWITVTNGSSGAGNKTINLSISPNAGIARTGTVTVGGQSFTVNQAAGCSYSVTPTNANFDQTGGTGTVNVTTQTGCAWSSLSNVPWITTFVSGSNNGSGAVTFSVAANTGASRTGTITIAGQTFTVTQQQSGPDFTLSTTTANLSASGGTGSFSIATTNPAYSWTAASTVPWITITSGVSGTGNGSVTYTVQPNEGAIRTATIVVNGQDFRINQAAGAVSCSYNFNSTNSNVIPAAGGDGSFSLNTTVGCPWAIQSNDSWISITTNNSSNGTVTFSYSVSNNAGQARTGTISVAGQIYTVVQSGTVGLDFDGDKKSDVSVYRPSTGDWHLLQSRDGYTAKGFGNPTDKLVPADYDGDTKTDIAVFREDPNNPNFAHFYLMNSSDNTVRAIQFGSTGDTPITGDWDGDFKADIGVYRAGTQSNPQGYFYYRPSSQPTTNFIPIPWGSPGDKTVIADFDADGKTDAAVFRPSTGVWYIQRSRDGFYAIQFGASEDKPVVSDFDGDGKADQAVYRPSNGVWYVWRSKDNSFSAAQFGVSTDKPAPADYDGDGKTDMAVYRDGTWFILNSTSGFAALGFGNSTDKPMANSFVP